jgi:O-methyltransferase/8-demethyl-8-(2,3-dimethoxy-alpha-L-rhamnosyl)tetracenomycin-C 4'-O-methyltransferase
VARSRRAAPAKAAAAIVDTPSARARDWYRKGLAEQAANRLTNAAHAFERALHENADLEDAARALQKTLHMLAETSQDPPPQAASAGITLYLDLLARCLTGMLDRDPPADFWSRRSYEPAVRRVGEDWPSTALTMIGWLRLDNLRRLAERVIIERVPGDFIETGVWRGGACIMMRAVLKAYGDTARRVWVADSFAGVPPPDPARYPADRGDDLHRHAALAIDEATVRDNFRRHELLDEQVCFLPGRFEDTLGNPRIAQLAILRLDGDLYQSTIEALAALYPKLSPGGFVIIDDFGAFVPCLRAVVDYRKRHAIDARLMPIDRCGVYWQKPLQA